MIKLDTCIEWTAIDTREWLETVGTRCPELEALADELHDDAHEPWDDHESILHAIQSRGNYAHIERDNVYNRENSFSDMFTYSVYADKDDEAVQRGEWYYSQAPVYVAICMHRGGDVRGNYGPVEIYRLNDEVDNFLYWDIHWYCPTMGESFESHWELLRECDTFTDSDEENDDTGQAREGQPAAYRLEDSWFVRFDGEWMEVYPSTHIG